MADPIAVLERVRKFGANIVLAGDDIRLVNARKLPEGAIDYIGAHRDEIVRLLRSDQDAEVEHLATIIEFGAKAPREWAWQFAELLIRMRPDGISDADWSWFITRCGQIIDACPERDAA